MQSQQGARQRGIDALRGGNAAEACRLLAEVVQADSLDAEAWSALGVGLCQCGRLPEGTEALTRAVNLRPDRAPLHFNLARGLELAQRPQDALASYRRALQLDPHHSAAADAVRRLANGSAPIVPSDQSTPGAQSVPGDQTQFVYPGAVAPRIARQPVAPMPPVARVASGQTPALTPQPSRTPWGLIIAIIGGCLVGGAVITTLAIALMLPAIQSARRAAEAASRRDAASRGFRNGPLQGSRGMPSMTRPMPAQPSMPEVRIPPPSMPEMRVPRQRSMPDVQIPPSPSIPEVQIPPPPSIPDPPEMRSRFGRPDFPSRPEMPEPPQMERPDFPSRPPGIARPDIASPGDFPRFPRSRFVPRGPNGLPESGAPPGN